MINHPLFTVDQLRRLANIFDNAGQVLFAGAVIGPIISGFEQGVLLIAISGIIGMFVCWSTAIYLERKN